MAEQPKKQRGLFSLIADVPSLIVELFRQELESFKVELTKKATGIAVGVGLLVGAGVVAMLALIMLMIAGVFALALVVPTWAAALIVAGFLLLIVLVLALVGRAQLKRGDLGKTVKSVQRDVDTITGTGKRN
jgi:uncharacterized membrane protein YqjE